MKPNADTARGCQARTKSGLHLRRRVARGTGRVLGGELLGSRSGHGEQHAGVPATIMPPFGVCAKEPSACSISKVLRIPIGLISTPRDGATAWMAANWAMPDGIEASR